ncbi:F-type H+-transporting ATPase subunit a [Mobilisporobacter senegalensis]|uniref:ATP synthase subunit a n=1 Tax=Mobilisporobacter senegalensis TaxID=1329262 RepID=A0A3N1XVM2_9FIRM|nr:F0F1 ATP synthase subunit A [Mobilisporobacter senegalensis]ROR30675.1 F-type H+-transporting ATPase subunit a [Mobilisporobacter senegalensis]
MEDLATELMSQLETKISFVIPIFEGIPVPASVVVTWGIMAFLMILTLVFVRNLKMVPTGPQIYVEALVGFINNFFEDILGEEGKRYIPYLGTVIIYIACANLIGIIGITPPTKDLNVTAGLAIMSIILIEYSGIHAKGGKGYLKSFAEPMALLAPINILEIIIRPLSLCMRLFGNVLGAFVVMELIKIVAPAIVPIPLSFYFDVFDGLIQAYVFVFLTSLFIKEKME